MACNLPRGEGANSPRRSRVISCQMRKILADGTRCLKRNETGPKQLPTIRFRAALAIPSSASPKRKKGASVPLSFQVVAQAANP
ncbi:unnamed protein product [Trichobilharzia regenti]|nr:unnamed protein product [Trichobilharzia regenti]